MKKIKLPLLVLFVAIISIPLRAEIIEAEKAKEMAQSFLGKKVAEEKNPSKHLKKISSDNGERTLVYILNAEDGEGYVLVAGDDCVNPILGYSDTGNLDYEKCSESTKWIIDQYANIVDANRNNVKENTYRHNTRPHINKQFVNRVAREPLITTFWHQGDPYNKECPELNGYRAVTGCVATAMAQVVNYEKKSNSVKGIDEYTTANGYHIPALPEKEFNFGNLSDEDIAELMRYCGQSVEMDYGVDESGAQSEKVPDALKNYFGWEQEYHLLYRDNYNDSHWHRIVTEEINDGHPLIYSALSNDGLGHSFVVDGYSDDYFHVNWGWGGMADGYFDFSLFGTENQSTYILLQNMVTTRNDEPSNEDIDYGTTIDGINYELNQDLKATVLPLKNGGKYKGELIIPSSIEYEGKTYTVSYFGARAFKNCNLLTSIFIPRTIISQAWSVFDGCRNLSKVDVEDMAAFINLEVGGYPEGSPLFYGADLYLNGKKVVDLEIPEGITKIDYMKFAKCPSIQTVVLPSTMKVLGQYCFADCPNLRSIDMDKSSVEVIDFGAFLNNVSLQEVNLPASLKMIYHEAFGHVNGDGCRSLRKVVCNAPKVPAINGDGDIFSLMVYSNAPLYVPSESVEAYKKSKGWGNFLDIYPLSQARPLTRRVKTVDGCFAYEIDLDDKFAIVESYKNEEEWDPDVIIPEYITYENNSYPVEEIGYEVFYAQTFSGITIPDRVRKIGIRSFMGANFNCHVALPSALTRIPPYSLWAIKTPKLTIGENVKELGENALAWHDKPDWELETPAMEELECLATVPPHIFENSIDQYTYKTTKLSVPYGCKKAYTQAEGWSNFSNVANIGIDQEPVLDYDLSLTAQAAGKSILQKGMNFKVAGKVFNRGLNPIEKYTLRWSVDDVNIGEDLLETELSPNASCDFQLDIPIDVEKSGNHELAVSVIPIDNNDSDPADNKVIIPFELLENAYYRVSLLELFTSEYCGFTPTANENMTNDIERSDNKDFVARVSHHCGYIDDFLTLNHDYEWFYQDWGAYTPAIMMNRSDFYETGLTPVMEVGGDFENILLEEAGLSDAMVSMFFDKEEDNLSVKTVLTKNSIFDNEAGYDYVTVFLIEDFIPAQNQYEVWSEGILEEYYHHNVLRKILTPTWGTKIEWNGDQCLYDFKTKLNPEWNEKNLSAVAFIHKYDKDSRIDCQVYTAGATSLPQYIACPDKSSPWIIFDDESGVKSILSYGSSRGNIGPDEIISIYNLDGILVRDNCTIEAIDSLNKGFYLIVARNPARTIKIIK